MEPVVTAGLDGSPESYAAARWAAGEAQQRGRRQPLPHAWPMLAPEPTCLPAEVDQNYCAKRPVHNARAELQDRRPGLTIVGDLVADDAEHALLQAASESEMIVLGSRGPEPVAGYFLGGIGMHVVSRSSCPVVLARVGRPDTEEPPLRDLGVDHDLSEELRKDAQKELRNLAPRRDGVASAAVHQARCPVAVVPHD